MLDLLDSRIVPAGGGAATSQSSLHISSLENIRAAGSFVIVPILLRSLHGSRVHVKRKRQRGGHSKAIDVAVSLRGGETQEAQHREQRQSYFSKRSHAVKNLWVEVQRSMGMMKTVSYTFREVPGYPLLVATLLLLTVCVSVVSIVFNFLGRDFWEALSEKDPIKFRQLVFKFFLALLVGAPTIGLHEFVKDKLQLLWRAALTRRMLGSYVKEGAYYALELNHKDIDNPDQRVTEDVTEFTDTCVKFFVSLGSSLLDLVAFSVILFIIHPPLFAMVLAYSTAGTGVALLLGHRLVGLNMGQIRREADLRYSLIRIRENAEAIAFYGGERAERRLISRHLDSALENTRRLITTERNLGFFTAGYELLVEVLPALLVAPVYFAGRMGLGQVSQVFSAFSRVLYSTSIIIDNLEELSQLGAGAERIGSLLERLKSFDDEGEARRQSMEVPNTHPQPTHHAYIPHSVAQPSAVAAASGLGKIFGRGTSGWSQKPHHHVYNPLHPSHNNAAPGTHHFTPHVANRHADTDTLKPPIGIGHGQDKVHLAFHTSARNGLRGDSGLEVLRLDDVTIVTPDRSKTLIHGVSLTMAPGQRLLIMGPSGAGKSSLLRAIAGMWKKGSGVIYRPFPSETFFLPQRPYSSQGSLREQVMYPTPPQDRPDVTDAELLQLLQKVGLGELPLRAYEQGKGVPGGEERGTFATEEELEKDPLALQLAMDDMLIDWGDVLSLGEAQRLAFARLLFNGASLALIDEATSALEEEAEEHLYELLETMPDLTLISVGHRKTLRAHHTHVLTLGVGKKGDKHKQQTWSFEPLPEQDTATEAKSVSALTPASTYDGLGEVGTREYTSQ